MEIGLYGGSCDPVTHAHIDIAREALLEGLDEVWLMPTWRSPDKPNLTPYALRRAMLEIAIKDEPNIKICDFEMDHECQGETWDTMSLFFDLMPDYNYSMIIGLDCAMSIHTWKRGIELTELLPFIVVYRHVPDKKLSINIWFNSFGHSTMISTDRFWGMSSTEAREKIKNGESALDIVQVEVLQYIIKQKLYREEK